MIRFHLRRLALTVVAVAGSTAIVHGQEALADTTALPPRAGFSIQAGQIGLNSAAFNAQIAPLGRGLLKKSMVTLGVESWIRWDRMMLLASSQAYVPTTARATNYTTEASGGHGSLDLGVPIVISRTTLIYPMAGLGVSNTTVTLRRNGTVDFVTNFRDITPSGGRNVDITARRYQAHVGVGLDRVFQPQWPGLLVSVGLRAGYMAPLGDTRWRSGPENVAGAPALGLQGSYIRLTLGGVLAKRRYAAVPMIGSLLPYIRL